MKNQEFYKIFIFILCIWHFAWMYVSEPSVFLYPMEAEEDTEPPGTGVIGGCVYLVHAGN